MASLWLYSLELEVTFTAAAVDAIELDSYDPATIEARSIQDVSALDSFAPAMLGLHECGDTSDLDSHDPATIEAEGANQ